MKPPSPSQVLNTAKALRWQVGSNLHERVADSIYTEAARLADRAVTRPEAAPRFDLDRTIDRLVTSRIWGFPIMALLFALIFWITITGANIPSGWLAELLIGRLYPWLQQAALGLGFPWWLKGVLVDGMYLATAWVVSVMLPPMAIFFPLFTLLEDFGYLPRVAFNLDRLFKRAGAHGKQSLSMMMGFGCNAAGVIATRVIDSPRERLIAILTNNFALCNGRWPTQFLLATIFVGALAPAAWAGAASGSGGLSISTVRRTRKVSPCSSAPSDAPRDVAPIPSAYSITSRSSYSKLIGGSSRPATAGLSGCRLTAPPPSEDWRRCAPSPRRWRSRTRRRRSCP